MLDKSIWIFFFKQKKSLVFVVCPSHPFSGIYVWWSFGLCYFNTWVSIKCLLRGYVMLLVYFAKWKVRTQNKPATAETHSSSAVSWSLAVPISIQEPFFFITITDATGTLWSKMNRIGDITERLLALRQEPTNAWEDEGRMTSSSWALSSIFMHPVQSAECLTFAMHVTIPVT